MGRGLILTLRSLGLGLTLKEILRRFFNFSYTYNGIRINSDELFRLVRNIALKNFQVYGLNDEIIVSTNFGEIGVSITDYNLLWVLLEPLEKIYGCVDVKDAVVVDIGAFIGDTALFFLSRGARKVYAFEPVKKFYNYLERNVLRNNAEDRIVLHNFGVWAREKTLHVSLMGAGTSQKACGDQVILLRVRNFSEVLESVYDREGCIDLVKMDCEGCEYSLLNVDGEIVRLPRYYIIEIHGSEVPIIDKMGELGYKGKLITELSRMKSVYLFTHY